MKKEKINLLWVGVAIAVIIGAFVMNGNKGGEYNQTSDGNISQNEIVQEYKLELHNAIPESKRTQVARGLQRFLDSNATTISSEKELKLADFDTVVPMENEAGNVYTFTGHQVYLGTYKAGFYQGFPPNALIPFIVSGFEIIPIDLIDVNNITKHNINASGMIYKEGTAERIYVVDSEAERDLALEMLDAAKPILNSEEKPAKGQIILDGRLLPCVWTEVSDKPYVPIGEVAKYLYTNSYVDEHAVAATVNSTSANGVHLKTQNFPTLYTPTSIRNNYDIVNGVITAYSSDTGVTESYEIAVGENLHLSIESLNTVFGWDFYLDEDENLLVIITDESNLTDNFIVKPSNE